MRVCIDVSRVSNHCIDTLAMRVKTTRLYRQLRVKTLKNTQLCVKNNTQTLRFDTLAITQRTQFRIVLD